MIKKFKKEHSYLFFSFFIVSFICWVLELLYSLVFRDAFVLPGVMLGPYLPIYGSTFVLLELCLRKKDNIMNNFLKTGIIAAIMEYVVSFISDTVFNHIIWDYSDSFMNLHGRICLEMTMIFTLLGLSLYYLLDPILRKIYVRFEKGIKVFNKIMIVVFVLDIIVNTIWL